MTFAPRFWPTIGTLLIVSLAASSGCGNKSTTASSAPTKGSAADPSAQDQVAPDSLVESAVQILQSSKRNREAHQIAAQRLNQYLGRAQASGESPIADLSADVRNVLSARLTAQQVQLLESKQFDRPDASHLESCFLFRDTVNQIIAGKRDKPSKAFAIFDWVIRNIHLVDADEPSRVSLIPPYTMLIGRGDQSERAWTFMELLRQAEIDSVL